jgi:sterol desaturase/sphingolipid hydroxylase (fatty acid hydroxylase superfamily)
VEGAWTWPRGKIGVKLRADQRQGPRFSASIYAALVGSACVAAWLALRRGAEPGRVLLTISIAAAVAVAALEHIVPYRRQWLKPKGDLLTDLLHLVFTGLLAAGGRWFNAVAILALGLNQAATAASLWPASWPLPAQLALALLVQDFCGYWVHRAQHEIRVLWRFHSIHHSAPRLYWLNQMRNHPIDAMISGASIIPVAVLGAPEGTLAAYGVLTTVHLLLQHANIDYHLGWADRLLSAARAHRWHHSRRPEEANGNYGSVLLVWDRLFRTRIWPADREPPVDTGLGEPHADFPRGYLGQLAAPFQGRRW